MQTKWVMLIVLGIAATIVIGFVIFKNVHNDGGEAQVEHENYREIAEQLSKMKPEIDYVEHCLIAGAEDEKQAEEIAKAVGGTLESFEYGIATIHSDETVLDLMNRLSKEKGTLPNVGPNYMMSID